MLTTGMGGVLPEQPDPTIFHDVLDMGCGTGGWITEVAKAYPGVACIGIDISKRMIEYAKTQANEQQIHEQLAFLIMDALKPLAFADKSFDLINMRLGVSFMRTWDWSNLLNELRRIIRPNGIIRIVEGEIIHQSNSSALTKLCEMVQAALYQSGHLFTEQSKGVIGDLPRLLDTHGFVGIQTKDFTLEYHPGTPETEAFREDMALAFQTLFPFIKKWHRHSERLDYDTVYKQALVEMHQPDFFATVNLHVVWSLSSGKPYRGL